MEQAKHMLDLPTLAVVPRKGVMSGMSKRSILVKPEIDKLLHVAKECIEHEQALQQMLFLHVAGDQLLQMPLTLTGDAEAKASQLLMMGRHLHERGLTPDEAVLLSESWFVEPWKVSAAMKFAPSKHPARQEAIVVVGRSADNRRYTQVIQPFTRDKTNRALWQPLLLAMYDEPRTPQDGPTGILDFFFEGIPARA
jgi:hypothetical protein